MAKPIWGSYPVLLTHSRAEQVGVAAFDPNDELDILKLVRHTGADRLDFVREDLRLPGVMTPSGPREKAQRFLTT